MARLVAKERRLKGTCERRGLSSPRLRCRLATLLSDRRGTEATSLRSTPPRLSASATETQHDTIIECLWAPVHTSVCTANPAAVILTPCPRRCPWDRDMDCRSQNAWRTMHLLTMNACQTSRMATSTGYASLNSILGPAAQLRAPPTASM